MKQDSLRSSFPPLCCSLRSQCVSRSVARARFAARNFSSSSLLSFFLLLSSPFYFFSLMLETGLAALVLSASLLLAVRCARYARSLRNLKNTEKM
jgi:hypothetical protein